MVSYRFSFAIENDFLQFLLASLIQQTLQTFSFLDLQI